MLELFLPFRILIDFYIMIDNGFVSFINVTKYFSIFKHASDKKKPLNIFSSPRFDNRRITKLKIEVIRQIRNKTNVWLLRRKKVNNHLTVSWTDKYCHISQNYVIEEKMILPEHFPDCHLGIKLFNFFYKDRLW